METCKACGKEMVGNVKFCPECGAPAQSAELPSGIQAGAPGKAVPPPGTGVVAQPPPGITEAPGAGPGAAPYVPPTPPPPVYPRKGRGLSRGGVIALVVGACVLVLVLVMVILFVFVFVNVLAGPADVANDYMKALKAGNLSSAWSYLSEKAQKEEGRSGFEKKVGVYKGQIDRYYTRKINVSGSNAQVTMELKLSSGEKGNWYFDLVKEGGKWRIVAVSPEKPAESD